MKTTLRTETTQREFVILIEPVSNKTHDKW